ncbi:MAG: hypothetical protein R2681_05110 [Pyrinomonadaceae bacterium]
MKFKPGVLCSLLPLLIVFGYTTHFANEAQSHIFRTGINLGQVEARLEFLYKISPNGPVPPAQLSAIATNLSNAYAHIETADSLFNNPRSPNRAQQTRNVLTLISGYENQNRGKNFRARAIYIRKIVANYRSLLAVTFSSSRNDAFQSRTNCDSRIFDTGYNFGMVILTSTMAPGNKSYRSKLRADTYQRNRFSAMNGHIEAGLRLAQDGYAPGARSGNVYKVCCSFGPKQNWDAFRSMIRGNSTAAEYERAKNYQINAIAASNLRPGACGSNSVRNGNQPSNTVCQWRPKTVLGQTTSGCECWCNGSKSSNSRCGGTPPRTCGN